MQNFNDRLLFIVDRVVGKLGLVPALLDRVMTRLVPQATAMALCCPYFCGYTCNGVCGTGHSLYEFAICSTDQYRCYSNTWTCLIQCGC